MPPDRLAEELKGVGACSLRVTKFSDPASILVVEDETFVRMAAVDVLSDTGATLYEAGDADEALTLIEAHPEIDLIFTDISMPGEMDGMALARRVHHLRPAMAIVVTSGKHRLLDSELPDDGIFLAKPYRAEQLVRAVERQLAGAA